MENPQREHLLAELHRGSTSRNRDFQRFQDPESRRVLRAYRRLGSLLGEIGRTDLRVSAAWSRDGRSLTVECHCPRLRYRRRLTLTEWEAAFLLRTRAGSSLAAPAADFA